MNKICIIAKNKSTYFINRLIEEVGQDIALFDPWSDAILPEAQHYIVRTTGVYRNDLDLMMIGTLPADKIINPIPVLKRFRTKISQYQWFEEADVPSLPWLPLKGTDLLTVEKFFRLYPEVVVKPFAGQGGWGVEALTWDKFKTWWNKKKGVDEEYLIQPFLKNVPELRYFFLKGSAPVVLERKSKSGVAANFQKQGSADLSTLPAEHVPVIEALIEKSGALYGAIDILIQDGRLYVLELNAVPGIEQLEKVSGQNVMKSVLSSLVR